MTFLYEDVSKSVEKKTTAFEFPDADGTYIQDLGHSGRKYPLRVLFYGDDCDLYAENFEIGLLEIGIGRLEHPIYGVLDVVPFGKISRRDYLKTAANQVVIDVVFWETTGLVYPTSQSDRRSAVTASIKDFNNSASDNFSKSIDIGTAIKRAITKNKYTKLLSKAKSNLQKIADFQTSVKSQFDTIVKSINNGIDILIADPLSLAFQTTQLIQAPASAFSQISARLEAYGDLAKSIISGNGANTYTPEDRNLFEVTNLYVSAAVTGSVVSVVNNQFATKIEALEAAEEILSISEAVTEWQEEGYESVEAIDEGGAYQALQDAVATAAGYLIEISFTLKQERTIVLDRARTIIDLAAELYGSVDDQLDFLINSNSLSGAEILELPRGREIVYYV
jgi:prophage DNA circulation protein